MHIFSSNFNVWLHTCRALSAIVLKEAASKKSVLSSTVANMFLRPTSTRIDMHVCVCGQMDGCRVFSYVCMQLCMCIHVVFTCELFIYTCMCNVLVCVFLCEGMHACFCTVYVCTYCERHNLICFKVIVQLSHLVDHFPSLHPYS